MVREIGNKGEKINLKLIHIFLGMNRIRSKKKKFVSKIIDHSFLNWSIIFFSISKERMRNKTKTMEDNLKTICM